MECKFAVVPKFFTVVIELIDTLWNVNKFGTFYFFMLTGELIDTLWNVNNISEETLVGTITELIDTLWNVNNGMCTFEAYIPEN